MEAGIVDAASVVIGLLRYRFLTRDEIAFSKNIVLFVVVVCCGWMCWMLDGAVVVVVVLNSVK